MKLISMVYKHNHLHPRLFIAAATKASRDVA